jgi:hypothetical protein
MDKVFSSRDYSKPSLNRKKYRDMGIFETKTPTMLVRIKRKGR